MVVPDLVVCNNYRCNCVPDDFTLLPVLENYKMKKITWAVCLLWLIASADAVAQCAMCKRTAETNNESKNKPAASKSLNSGILYLLSVPYLIGAVGAIAWYRNRKKED